jgi:hypothetical protein
MPEVLQLAHLVEHDRMPQVDVGRRRVQAELDAQGRAARAAAGQLGGKLGRDEQFIAAALSHTQIMGNLGVFRGGGGRHDDGFIRKIEKMLDISNLMR